MMRHYIQPGPSYRRRQNLQTIWPLILLVIAAVILGLPFFWMFTTAFKPPARNYHLSAPVVPPRNPPGKLC